LMEDADWPRWWYGVDAESCDGLIGAGRGGTGGIEDVEEPWRRTGGALGWLRLTLPAAAAVAVYAGGGGTQLSASLSWGSSRLPSARRYSKGLKGRARRCRRFAGDTAATVAARARDICDLGCWLSYGASKAACASSAVNSSSSATGGGGGGIGSRLVV
jgi:hypothetical protein